MRRDLSETFACIVQVGTGGSNQVGAARATAASLLARVFAVDVNSKHDYAPRDAAASA